MVIFFLMPLIAAQPPCTTGDVQLSGGVINIRFHGWPYQNTKYCGVLGDLSDCGSWGNGGIRLVRWTAAGIWATCYHSECWQSEPPSPLHDYTAIIAGAGPQCVPLGTWDSGATVVAWPSVASPSLPPSPESPRPTPPAVHDGAIMELTGVAPKIIFGTMDAPVCELSLNRGNSWIESSCPVISNRRRLDDDEFEWKSKLEALKAEVAELRHKLNELDAGMAHK